MAFILEKAIGKGLTFPIELSTDPDTGKTLWKPVNGDTKLIEDNLRSLLAYSIGQRLREEDFGTRLQEVLEEPNTQALVFLARIFLKNAIEYWEQRLEFLDLKHSSSKESLYFRLVYKVKLTQDINSLDFSFNPKTGNIDVSQ